MKLRKHMISRVLPDSIAEELGLEMEEDAASIARLNEMYAAWGRKMPENNVKQAWFPRGAHILKNARGTAPGCAVEVNGKKIFAADEQLDINSDELKISGKIVTVRRYLYIMLNKPSGVLSAAKDPD